MSTSYSDPHDQTKQRQPPPSRKNFTVRVTKSCPGDLGALISAVARVHIHPSQRHVALRGSSPFPMPRSHPGIVPGSRYPENPTVTPVIGIPDHRVAERRHFSTRELHNSRPTFIKQDARTFVVEMNEPNGAGLAHKNRVGYINVSGDYTSAGWNIKPRIASSSSIHDP